MADIAPGFRVQSCVLRGRSGSGRAVLASCRRGEEAAAVASVAA